MDTGLPAGNGNASDDATTSGDWKVEQRKPMKCIICAGTGRIIYENLIDRVDVDIPGRFTLKRCSECGLLFVDPQPSEEELSAHYPPTYHVYGRVVSKPRGMKGWITKHVANAYLGYGSHSAVMRVVLWPFFFRLADLPHFRPDGVLLDVGCGVGTRLPLFQMLGWTVEGLEIDPAASEAARKAGYNVHTGAWGEVSLPRGHYNVLYLNNVFEHLGDPVGALREMHHVLKEDGELVLVVPNSRSPVYRCFGKHWFALEIPRHLFTYNETNLRQLLSQHGFVTTQVSFMHTLGSLTSSFAYWLGKGPGAFMLLNCATNILDLLLDPLTSRFGLGEWLVIHATKH